MTSYRNSAEILLEWRRWKDETWALCPFASHDRTKCSPQHCPCTVLTVNLWVNTISGYLGTVKVVKFLGRDNGKGSDNGDGNKSGEDSVKVE